MEKMKIAVTGAAGRMGRELIRAVHGNDNCVIAGGIEQEGSIALGQDVGLLAGLGKLGVVITDDPLELFAKVDAVLDFTVPAASVEFAALAANARIVHVLGTTGMKPADDAKVEAAARHATIIKAGNMSLGVNLLTALTRKVAAALDADFDIEILEMHHRHKVDAPSGTALMLGKAAAEGRGVKLDETPACACATVTPASASAATSASRPCAAAAWSASTRCCSRPTARSSSCATSPPIAASSPAAPSRPPCGAAAKARACSTCSTCSASTSA